MTSYVESVSAAVHRAPVLPDHGVRLHPNEKDRLDSPYSYAVLDTEPEPAFDALTRLAARVCGAPIAGVSLVDRDRQWFKSFIGGPR